MGKNPAEVKNQNKKVDVNAPKNTLFVTHYIKKNGNVGMRKQFKKV